MFIPFPIYVIGRENFVTVHFVPGNLAKLYFRSSGGIIICGQLCFSVYRDSNTGSSAELMQIVYYEQLADAKPFFIRPEISLLTLYFYKIPFFSLLCARSLSIRKNTHKLPLSHL